MITNIYNNLLQEAKTSPRLLSDLAGLETYISESYTNRSFIELLQNADDAQSTYFYVENYKQHLIIANNGREFNDSDIESLCRSASSKKNRGTSIGYRGIGFKSVVSVANEVHLISGEYQITFSRELTKHLLPDSQNIPLIRIPHPIRTSIINEFGEYINSLKKKGLTTFFIFSGVEIEKIENEYSSFNQTSLLFLHNIKTVETHLKDVRILQLNISSISNDTQKIQIKSKDNESNWVVYTKKNCSIAFYIKDNRISRLPRNESTIHAFLPTEDTSSLGVIINADFSTDPSRRHLIFDDFTSDSIKQIVNLYYELLQKYVFSYSETLFEPTEYINALMPYFDIRLIHLTKSSFEKLFSFELKSLVEENITNIRICPKWFNVRDFISLTNNAGNIKVNENCFSVQGFESLLKYFGCQTSNIDEILEFINTTEISLLGYSQIASEAIRQIIMNANIPLLLNANIFSSSNKLSSLSNINKNNGYIDNSYIQLLQDNGTTLNDLNIFLKKLSLDNILKLQFPENKAKKMDVKEHTYNCQLDILDNKEVNIISNSFPTCNKSNEPENNLKKSTFSEWLDMVSKDDNKKEELSFLTPKKWRSVEENTLLILNSNGFTLKDVSKQNVGYDLEGNDPNGNPIYIEIKSLEYYGQKFRMTNNEYAVAQYKTNEYYLALVVLSSNSIEISLIKDPINKLKLDRQCVQWIWECSEYKYSPFKFILN